MTTILGKMPLDKNTFTINDLDGDGIPETLKITVGTGQSCERHGDEDPCVTRHRLRLSTGRSLKDLTTTTNAGGHLIMRGKSYQYVGIPLSQRGNHFATTVPIDIGAMAPTEPQSKIVQFETAANDHPAVAISCSGSRLQLHVTAIGVPPKTFEIPCDNPRESHKGLKIDLGYQPHKVLWNITTTNLAPELPMRYAVSFGVFVDVRSIEQPWSLATFHSDVAIKGGALTFTIRAKVANTPAFHNTLDFDIDHLQGMPEK